MYKDYYHLKAEPFSTHPNTGTFFVSETHKQAWYYLLFGIDTQEPFLVLTGDYGMGKTLLCLRLIKFLKEKGMARVEYIPTSNEGYGGVLRRIAMSLGISPLPQDEEILQDMIYDSFRAETEKTKFYLIIDDVHELDLMFLTKLKYLSTFNHDEFFPVIMVFVGHPSFLQDLKTPALNSLNQRIKRRYHLARFGFEDTKSYIYFRLLKSGAVGIPAFPNDTIRKIYEYSGGVPRLINNICDTCLLIGASKQLASIHPAIVDEAKNLVEGSLTGADAADQTDADATYEMETAITFSEDLPTFKAPPKAPESPAQPEAQEYQQEYQPEVKPPPKYAAFNQKLKKTLKITAAGLVLLLCVAAGIFIYANYNHILSIYATLTQSAQKDVPAQVEKAVEGVPRQLEKIVESAPALREESSDKTSGDAHARRGTETSASTDYPSKRTGGTDTYPPPRESLSFHPYSLRSASYQQLDMALKEISELRQMGLIPYLVKVDMGSMGILWRTYIGFFTTEAEARKAKSAHKLNNVTVQKTEFACQIGEFGQESEGYALFEKLKQAGYYPYMIQKEKNHFRVYLGAYEKRSEAEALNQELQNRGIKSKVVAR
jgi:type II secretory pathway predicted ATPase ExeA